MAPSEEYCITKGCKHKRKDTDDMLRCMLCCTWFHHVCVGLDPSKIDGAWSCPACRTIHKDVTEIKKMLDTVLGVLTKQNDIINDLKESLEEKNGKCESLLKENVELNRKIFELTKKRKIVQQKFLLMGSSIIREVSKDKLIETDVICKRGGKIADICDEVEKIPSHYGHIALVIGGNDCESKPQKNPTEIVEDYSKLIDRVKAKADSVTVSSICPRQVSNDVQQTIDAVNAGLIATCSEKEVTYADSTPCFKLSDGTINDGYLTPDGVHITKKATNKVIKCLNLPIKDVTVGACKDFGTQIKKQTDQRYKIQNQENHQAEDETGKWTTVHRYQRNRRSEQADKDTRCHFCAETGHTKKTCRHGKEVRCHSCDLYGHKAKFCSYSTY